MKTKQLKDGLTYYIPKVGNYTGIKTWILFNNLLVIQQHTYSGNKIWNEICNVNRSTFEKPYKIRESKKYIIVTPCKKGYLFLNTVLKPYDSNISLDIIEEYIKEVFKPKKELAGDRTNFQWKEELEDGVNNIEDLKKIWEDAQKLTNKIGTEFYKKFGTKIYLGTSGNTEDLKETKQIFKNE